MSFWKVMNWVAWGLSAFLLCLMLRDFLKVERQARAAKRDPEAGPAANGPAAGRTDE